MSGKKTAKECGEGYVGRDEDGRYHHVQKIHRNIPKDEKGYVKVDKEGKVKK